MSLAIAAYISLCLGFVLGWVAAVVLIPIASDEAERGVGRRRPARWAGWRFDMNRRAPERPRQPAVFWWLLAFNVIMYTLVIPLRMI